MVLYYKKIIKCFAKTASCNISRSTMAQRKFSLPIPSRPSATQRMDGYDWPAHSETFFFLTLTLGFPVLSRYSYKNI